MCVALAIAVTTTGCKKHECPEPEECEVCKNHVCPEPEECEICKNHVCPQDPDRQVTKTNMQHVSALYNGESEGFGSFTFDFCSAAFGEEGAIPANASGLHLELYSDIVAPADVLQANIKGGRYVIGNGVADFTISAGNSYYFISDASGAVTKTDLISGEAYFVITDGFRAAFVSDFMYNEADNKWISFEYNGGIEIEPLYDMVYTIHRNGWFWGDDQWDYPGIGQYTVIFSEGEVDNYGDLIEGDHLSFDFYHEMPPKAWEAQLPVDSYFASTTYKTGTFRVATQDIIDKKDDEPWNYYKYCTYTNITDGIESRYFVKDGTVKATKEGNVYTMKYNILLDNDEWYLAKYVGTIRQGDEYTRSTFVGDKTLVPSFGYLEYDGPSPMGNIKGVNRWNIRLYSEGVTVDPSYYWGVSGDGDFMRIQLYTDGHYTTEIPEGRYVISAEEVPYHANEGQGGWGITFGTWYYDMDENEAPAITGEVNISRDGSKYIVEVEFVDDRGNTIKTKYDGELTYWDNYNKSGYAPSLPAWLTKPTNNYEAGKSMKLARDVEAHYGK